MPPISTRAARDNRIFFFMRATVHEPRRGSLVQLDANETRKVAMVAKGFATATLCSLRRRDHHPFDAGGRVLSRRRIAEGAHPGGQRLLHAGWPFRRLDPAGAPIAQHRELDEEAAA